LLFSWKRLCIAREYQETPMTTFVWRRSLAICLGIAVLVAWTAGTADGRAARADEQVKTPAPKGQRVYSIGHSFHVFMPGILAQIAKSAGITDHKQVGLSSIGGSYVHQHWNVKDDKFRAKAILESGKLDVLTMAPLFLPDDGIDNFVKLAAEKSPHIRVLIQEFWLPFDVNTNFRKEKVRPPDRTVYDGKKLQEEHDKYFAAMDEKVKELNNQYRGRPAIFVAPVGQAVLALRKKIADGAAPGLTRQTDLFTDPIGHAKAPLAILVGYCYYAQIYGRSPVGLPVPPGLKGKTNDETAANLNRVLQEIAWKTVTEHPLSGVRGK
jgi:hypothetical protein